MWLVFVPIRPVHGSQPLVMLELLRPSLMPAVPNPPGRAGNHGQPSPTRVSPRRRAKQGGHYGGREVVGPVEPAYQGEGLDDNYVSLPFRRKVMAVMMTSIV